MERYKVTLAYDGTQFYGFQRQGKARTVQLEVESALRKLSWQGRTILSAGRTDRGVHAAGQVIAFDLEWAHSPQDLGRALNANLPEDVAVRAVEIAGPDFHPRYDAISRCYHYHLWFAPERDPLRNRYAWQVWPACDPQDLQAAARLLAGTHDFAAFGAPMRAGGSTIRTVFQASWRAEGEDGAWSFQVTANAFLYHMVRRMVFVQVLVGQQRLSLEDLRQAVEQASSLSPGLAPPEGLVLKAVQYADGVAGARQVT